MENAVQFPKQETGEQRQERFQIETPLTRQEIGRRREAAFLREFLKGRGVTTTSTARKVIPFPVRG